MTGSLVALLHLCDSLFPTGAFSHSDGLEAATTRGDIESPDDLRGWIDATLEALERLDGPALSQAWEAALERRFDVLASIDDEVHALRPSAAGRDASRAMGSRLLRTWQQVRPSTELQEHLARRATFTLPVAFGVVTACAGIPRSDAVEGFMYTRLAATVSAAMRLMPLGQQDAHRLLAEALERVPALAHALTERAAPLQAFVPGLDVMTMSQQYGRSRLFRS